jgi:hypothetical protein
MVCILLPDESLLSRFCDFASLNATGAYIDSSDTTLFDHCTDSLEVWVENSFVQIVGMADIIADHWFFTANSTLF